MNYSVLMMIQEGHMPTIDAEAVKKDAANIYITASSWQQAQELLEQGQDLAAEACRNWKPEKKPAADQKTYSTTNRSIEEMDELAKGYEETPEGQRFLKSIDAAKEFMEKNGARSLNLRQIKYLAHKHHNSLASGSLDLIALSYRQGYRSGKAAAKKKG